MEKLLKIDWFLLILFLLGEIVGGVCMLTNFGWNKVFDFCAIVTLVLLLESSVFSLAKDKISIFLYAFGLLFCALLFFIVGKMIFEELINHQFHFADLYPSFIFAFISTIWGLILWGIRKACVDIDNEVEKCSEMFQKHQEALIELLRARNARVSAEEERLRQEAFTRAKVEEERIRQEELKQQEYRNQCKEFVAEFWNGFLDSDEDTNVLLLRLSFTLENSGYRNWKTEFYDKVVAKVKATTRPPKSARSQQQSHTTDENLGGLKMYFNGIWLTIAQYRILSRFPQVKNLYGDDLLEFCRKLAEKLPEFANFKPAASNPSHYVSFEVKAACRFMGVKYGDLSEESLKQAYRRLALQYHPDRNKSANAAEMFSKLQKSHDILKKALQRKVA